MQNFSTARDFEGCSSPIGEYLNGFAESYHLLLEKYHHTHPVWNLCFSHPISGKAKIEIEHGDDELTIMGIWWVDNYDTFTKSTKKTKSVRCGVSTAELHPLLLKTFREVLSFAFGDWSQVTTGYQGIWDEAWTKEQFEELSRQWPLPRLSGL